jgi:hypothetical protein
MLKGFLVTESAAQTAEEDYQYDYPYNFIADKASF